LVYLMYLYCILISICIIHEHESHLYSIFAPQIRSTTLAMFETDRRGRPLDNTVSHTD